jgi:hypothetical protein
VSAEAVKVENGSVLIVLTPDEAAEVASDCRGLATALGLKEHEMELELRRASDFAQRRGL